jgi:hypothetical protein
MSHVCPLSEVDVTTGGFLSRNLDPARNPLCKVSKVNLVPRVERIYHEGKA